MAETVMIHLSIILTNYFLNPLLRAKGPHLSYLSYLSYLRQRLTVAGNVGSLHGPLRSVPQNQWAAR
jgi:hypothetical protein